MLFNSFPFLCVFLPLIVAAYWCILRGPRPQWAILALVLASYIFYLFGEPKYPWLLAVSVATNYVLGRAIGAAEGWRRWIAAASIALNLLVLGYFKYFNFFVDQLVDVGMFHSIPWRVALPLGISFFTFTQLAYLVDVLQRKAVEPCPVPYALFVTFFPHLIAGPILHHKEMMPQFQTAPRGLALNLYCGFAMFGIGLSKKVLLADPCGAISTEAFNLATSGQAGFVNAWIGAVAYAVQIYFDFSGYSDMAIGISQMLGIKLPVNFNSPYRAVSIIDFWKRWHITLSRFLRDYLYISLGGNRCGDARRYLNLFITMLLGGIWHGAGWTFVLWGAMHGAALSLAHGWVQLRKRANLRAVPRPIGWLATLLFVVVAWVPFRAPNIQTAFSMWRGMVGLNGFALPALGPLKVLSSRIGLESEAVAFGSAGLATIVLALAVAFLAPNSHQMMREFNMGLDTPGYTVFDEPSRWRLSLSWHSALAVGLLIGLSVRAFGSASEFIYFHF
jgi:D-alanyl-lipoteichoic acid acyltransferase DltB (MBOAT superfamily)